MDTGNPGFTADWHAWSIEGRLGDCVVADAELELHHLAHGGGELAGRESERVGSAGDLDNVNLDFLGEYGGDQRCGSESVL